MRNRGAEWLGRRLDFFLDAAGRGSFPVSIEEILRNTWPLPAHLELPCVLADFCFWHKKGEISRRLSVLAVEAFLWFELVRQQSGLWDHQLRLLPAV